MIYAKLMAIQSELKAPKGQYNSFGKYAYRSCEDILEAVKPLLLKHGAALTIADEVVAIGDRYYVKATASLYDTENGESLSNAALAREEDTKKGMDGAQVTGAASSYARKYALNGLFAIDDTKDADTDEHKQQTAKAQPKAQTPQPPQYVKNIDGMTCVLAVNGKYYPLERMNAEQLDKICGDQKYKPCWDEAARLKAGV